MPKESIKGKFLICGPDLVVRTAEASDGWPPVIPAGRGRSAVKTKNLFKPKEKK